MTLTNNIFTCVVKFEKGNQLPLVAVLFSTINFIGLEKESPIKIEQYSNMFIFYGIIMQQRIAIQHISPLTTQH